jgi:hypothetical protein
MHHGQGMVPTKRLQSFAWSEVEYLGSLGLALGLQRFQLAAQAASPAPASFRTLGLSDLLSVAQTSFLAAAMPPRSQTLGPSP